MTVEQRPLHHCSLIFNVVTPYNTVKIHVMNRCYLVILLCRYYYTKTKQQYCG